MWDHNCNILFLTFLHIMINLGISNASQKSECSWVTNELWSWNSLFVNKAQALFLFTIIDVIFFIQILFCLACNIVQQVILIVKLFVFKITQFLHSTWYVKPKLNKESFLYMHMYNQIIRSSVSFHLCKPRLFRSTLLAKMT